MRIVAELMGCERDRKMRKEGGWRIEIEGEEKNEKEKVNVEEERDYT